jgi:hypothetical protein
MRVAAILILSVLIIAIGFAQKPIAKDILKIADQIPSPPKDVAAAFAKCGSDKEDGDGKCSPVVPFAAFDKSTQEVNDAFVAQGKSDDGPLPPGVSPEMMKKAKDPEMQKKMKKMSKEEKMKMAMQMMETMQTPAITPDPPAVRAALDEWQKIYNTLGESATTAGAEQQAEIDRATADEKTHQEIADAEQKEIDKLPYYSSGEMSAHDPAQVKAVRLKAAEKHIALANSKQPELKKRWDATLAAVRTKYGHFQQKLAAAQYAVESKNYSTLKVLADAQLIMMKDIAQIAGVSRAAWEKSASWGAHKQYIQAH